MNWRDPLFWAATGAGVATIANFGWVATRHITELRVRTESSRHAAATSKNDADASLLEALESARRSNVQSAELLQKIEVELGLANGPASPER